jgi:hypothetical protein
VTTLGLLLLFGTAALWSAVVLMREVERMTSRENIIRHAEAVLGDPWVQDTAIFLALNLSHTIVPPGSLEQYLHTVIHSIFNAASDPGGGGDDQPQLLSPVGAAGKRLGAINSDALAQQSASGPHQASLSAEERTRLCAELQRKNTIAWTTIKFKLGCII